MASQNNLTEDFNRLYAAEQRVVYAYLMGLLSDRESATDLLQETFLQAWRRMETVQTVPAERRRFWLLAVARNLAHDHHRRLATRRRAETDWSEAQQAQREANCPEREAERQEEVAALDAAIAQLPEAWRVPLTLHLLGDLTSEEIGVALNRPAGTVRYQISQARKRLAQTLEEERRSRGE